MKINSLQIENVKRVKAVTLEPTPNGLTVIGGTGRARPAFWTLSRGRWAATASAPAAPNGRTA